MLALIASLGCLWLLGAGALPALWFGAGLAMANVLLSSWRVKAASQKDAGEAGGVFHLYFGAVERFVFTGLAFAVALGFFKLSPAPVLAGFGLLQLVFFAGPKNLTAHKGGQVS